MGKPGTLVDEAFIEKQQHNFLLAIDLLTPDATALELAWIDTSTGELFTQGSTLRTRSLGEDLARIAPAEVVLPAYLAGDEHASHPIRRALAELDTPSKVSFPIEKLGETPTPPIDSNRSFSAIPLLSSYISQTLLDQRPDLAHPLRVRPANTMRIDRVTLKALEIKQNNDGGRAGTLISVLDHTNTAAGTRLLSDRITSPSKSLSEIESRLSLVGFFRQNTFLRDEVVARLQQLDDEARLLQKMSIGRPTAEDLLMMAKAIRVQAEIKQVLQDGLKILATSGTSVSADEGVLRGIVADMHSHEGLAEKIEESIDIKALEAQQTRELAAGMSAAEAIPESVDETEEEGVDIWDIPPEVINGKKKETRAARILQPISKLRKAFPEPITWGKQEATVLQPECVHSCSTIVNY